MGLFEGGIPRGSWSCRKFFMGGLSIFKELNVSLFALKWAHWVTGMFAVEISWLPAAYAPSKLTGWNSLFVQNWKVVEFSLRGLLLISLLSVFRRSGDHVQWNLGFLFFCLLSQLSDLFWIALSLGLKFLNRFLTCCSDLINFSLM